MWEEIRLRSLGVIADAELVLGPGLTVITGETGAGKTMVVTALGLLRGGRSDAGLVRHGDHQSRVEARVRLNGLPEVAALVESTTGEVEEGSVILGRTVSREGRSRAYVGGASVPASVLGEISDHLVAVHGQSDQHRLLRPSAQLGAVDLYAAEQLAPLLAAYRPSYSRLTDVARTLEELTTRSRERAQELDLLTFGLQEVAAVDPQPGEDALLAHEENKLAHADTLLTRTMQAHALLSADGSESTQGNDALAAVTQAQGLLSGVRRHDPELEALGARLDEVSYVLGDVAADLASYARSVEVDPVRLSTVQERRAALGGLLRKYGASIDEVLAWAASSNRRRAELSDDDERIGSLTAERDKLRAELLKLAGRLSDARRRAGEHLAAKVSDELTALAMPHAQIGVAVASPSQPAAADLGPDGVDTVEITLAANPGSPVRPLSKGASGGELSRVMLALEVVLADERSVPTFVFDEVDAGIGGKAAVEVGRRLARLARHAQVVAVTHLPQVAAFADSHYHVVKADDGTVTTSGVEALDGEARVAELSRMLAGLEGSASARAHAEELLALAASDRPG